MIGAAPCANVKRISLSRHERFVCARRARECLRHSPLRGEPVAITPLALSDLTQTYRVTAGHRSAVLKLLPAATAELSARVHRFLRSRGIELPALIWTDLQAGAILQEDIGPAAMPADPDLSELLPLVRYVARLHDACMMDPVTAHAEFPDLAAGGFPTPARLAADIVMRQADRGGRLTGAVGDAADALAATMPSQPFLAISDVKREHFLFRLGVPVLVDLEMASFRDVPAANLATLFAFPGQFTAPLSPQIRRTLLLEYAAACASAPRDMNRFARSVEAAEFLLHLTLSQAATGGATPAFMTRDRRFRASSDGSASIEEALGPECFCLLQAAMHTASRLRVLDAGSGTGRTLREMAACHPAHCFVGIDLAPGAEASCAVAADAQSLPFADGAFDAALAVQLLQYLPDKLRTIEEIYRSLRPGGLAVFAMTEHFGRESAFVPPLAEIAAAIPRGIIHAITVTRLHSRRVMRFAMTRRQEDLRFPFSLHAAVPAGPRGLAPYFQSRYRPDTNAGREADLAEKET
jgi:SAM-dependent methyltransferase